jgi:hypothetical protein
MNDHRLKEKLTDPVAVFTSRTVKLGFEERFEEALHEFITQSLQAQAQ